MDATILGEQSAGTSAAVIDFLKSNTGFQQLAAAEGDAIIARDLEDDEKLKAGVQLSVERGVLEAQEVPPRYTEIDVLGKTPDDVCEIILENLGDAAKTGGVIILCGLSGTGKGTTVARLRTKYFPEGKATSWSNGNVFRSLTLLAATWCEQQPEIVGFDAEKALTSQNLHSFMEMLTFGKFNGKWDIQIQGLGISAFVSEIQNTDLKGPLVSKNIPTVAKQTQGEVVKFAASAAQQMGADGMIVLLEGREATVNYIPSKFRYTLSMSNPKLIGERRAAQRIAAGALIRLNSGECSTAASAITTECEKLVSEITSRGSTQNRLVMLACVAAFVAAANFL